MKSYAHASITIPRPREQVFDYATEIDILASTMKPYGPITGITHGEMLDGQPLATGARRRITMSDGVVLEEDILELDRPKTHRYRWTTGLRPPFSWLVKSGEGCWTFSDTDGGTHIDWDYQFELTSPLVYPLTFPIVALFQRWQTRGLERIRDALLEQPAPRPARTSDGAAARTSSSLS